MPDERSSWEMYKSKIKPELVAELILENDKKGVFRREIKKLEKKYENDPREFWEASVDEARTAFVDQIVASVARGFYLKFSPIIEAVAGSIDWEKTTIFVLRRLGYKNIEPRYVPYPNSYGNEGVALATAFRDFVIETAKKEKDISVDELGDRLKEFFLENLLNHLKRAGYVMAERLVEAVEGVIDWNQVKAEIRLTISTHARMNPLWR